MPLPIFIICSEGGSIDRHTNMVSIFDVIERLTFKVFDTPPVPVDSRSSVDFAGMKPASIHSLRMTAVWKRDDADIGKEFEFRTLIKVPGVSEPFEASNGRFVFRTVLYRIIATIHHDMPSQSGEIIVSSLIRQTDESSWMTQQYIIPVERIESANQPELPMS